LDQHAAPASQGATHERESWFTGQTLRECIAAVISLAIVAIALYLLVDTYTTGKAVSAMAGSPQQKALDDAYVRQKDLLLYALALLGTITGYYFGRVPAELHAQKADRVAEKAQAKEAETKRKVRTRVRAIKATEGAAKRGIGVRDASPGEAPQTSINAQLDALLEDLEE
jgi:hypothetical protein